VLLRIVVRVRHELWLDVADAHDLPYCERERERERLAERLRYALAVGLCVRDGHAVALRDRLRVRLAHGKCECEPLADADTVPDGDGEPQRLVVELRLWVGLGER